MARLLIIEDELPMRTALAETLEAHGYRVQTAADGPTGIAHACEHPPDLILLDVMLPGMDGFALCQELRRREMAMPVLMLTAKGLVDDRVQGLESGADDYLVKPFSMKELIARVRALLRRQEREKSNVTRLILGQCEIDFEKRVCLKDGHPLEMKQKEIEILRLLVENEGRPVSRDQFLDVVWEYNAYPSTRTVDNFIAAIRAKIEPDPADPRFILTVRGQGYRLGERQS